MENLFGLYKDGRPINAPAGAWEHAKNILVNRGFKSISNEDGFDLEVTLPYEIIGIIPTNLGYVIFSTDNKYSSIHFKNTDTGVLEELIKDNLDLNFRVDKPIEGVFKYNDLRQLIVCWTDFFNEPKVLNLNSIPSPLVINKITLSPNADFPSIEEEILNSGGRLTSGTYSFFTRYKNSKGTVTNWSLKRSPISITNSSTSEAYKEHEGSPVSYTTSKAININLSDIDLTFDKIEIAVLRQIDNNLSGRIIVELPVQSSLNYIYSGQESDTLDVTEALVQAVNYNKVKTIATLEDDLLIGNIEEADLIDYQKYANNIKIDWYAKLVNVTSYNHSSKVSKGNKVEKSFMPKEVYAFYFFFIDLKGKPSRAYHIPGREVLAGDRAASTLADTGFSSMPLKYEIEDTTTVYSKTTDGGDLAAAGLMGAFENKTEVYADEDCSEIWNNTGLIGDLAGVNVRHHRFPSLGFLKANAFNVAGGETLGVTHDVVLGIKAHSVYIPDDIKEQISGWGISYVKRDLDNMTILGQDILIYASEHKEGIGTPTEADFPTNNTLKGLSSNGLNIHFKNRYWDGSNFRVVNTDTLQLEYIRGLSPDLRHIKPDITPDYIVNELQYKIDFFAGASGSYHIFDTTKRAENPDCFNDYLDLDFAGRADTQGWDAVYTVNTPTSNKQIRKISDFNYYANNIFIDSLNYANQLKESFISYKLDNPSELLIDNIAAQDTMIIDQAITRYPYSTIDKLETNRISYGKLKDNIYTGYNEEKILITIENIADKTDTLMTVYGGDVFNSENHLTSHIRWVYNWNEGDLKQYILNLGSTWTVGGLNTYVHHHIALHTAHNWSLRYYDEAVALSKYSPKIEQGRADNGGELDWETLYNFEYSQLNEYNQTLIANCEGDVIKHPYRVQRGLSKNLNKDTGISWAEFLANDYYEMRDRDKGEVYKLVKYNNALLIHQKYSLFVAKIKDRLITDTVEVYLGKGDIFDSKPDEAFAVERGYTGNQSQWASIVCKLGYCFLDRYLGKVFIFNGKLEEISNKGLNNFFRDTINTSIDEDNPFGAVGLTMAYDNKYNRLLISKKEFEAKFTFTVMPDDIEGLETELELGDYIYWKGAYYLVVNDIVGDYHFTPIFVLSGGAGDAYGYKVNYYDETLFTNKGLTISYSPELNNGKGGWICFHDYYPSHMFSAREEIYALQNTLEGKIFKMNNITSKATFFDETIWKSYVDMIISVAPEVEKYFMSFSWDADVMNSVEKVLEDKTLTSIMIYNNNQCTGEIDLTISPYLKKNVRNVREKWNFNEFRDLVADRDLIFIDEDREIVTSNIKTTKGWFDKNIITSKFAIVRLAYNNEEQLTLYINMFNGNLLPTKQQ